MGAMLDQILAGGQNIATVPGMDSLTGDPANGNTPDTLAAPAITAPAPVSIPSMTAPGGALAQAVQIGKTTAKAGAAQVMSNPLVADYLAEKAKTDAASKAASDAYAANQAKIAALNAQPDVPHPDVPTLNAIPKETDDPAYVAAAKANPIKTLGMFLPILAAFGGLKTQNFAQGAMIAATGALNGAQAGNEAELKKAHDQWLDNTKQAIESNAELASQYRMALEDRSASMADRMAKVAAIAAENKDVLVQASLQGGHPDAILKLLDVTTAAGDHLQPIVLEAQKQAQEAAERADANARGWAELRVRQYQADVAAGKTSPNDVAGQIFSKILHGGYDSLTVPEKDTLSRLQTYEVSLHPQPGSLFSGPPAAAPGKEGPAAPPPALAPLPATSDTGAGALATSGPPQRADGVYTPTTFAEAAAVPIGAKFYNPADKQVHTKLR